MDHTVAAPIDRTLKQITVRGVVTGMVIGGLLSLCNIYSGLKIGWSSNMSVTAALLGFAIWRAIPLRVRKTNFTILECNINQTAASSAAAISSAGLVAAVPALTVLTGRELAWPLLALWTFSVCLVGISVAGALRKPMIVVDKLPFPGGIASAETLREIYAAGKEAAARVWMLAVAAVVSGGVKVLEHLYKIPKLVWPGSFTVGGSTVTSGNLTFAFEPTLLMVGVGALAGLRAGASMLLGAVVAYGVLAPFALEAGWARRGAPGGLWFSQLSPWLLWPGVAMMVTSALTSFAFSWRTVAKTFQRKGAAGGPREDDGSIPKSWFATGIIVSLILSVALQSTLFGIVVWIAAIGVLLSFVLAIVAARVSGETNATPIGAMGKITQLMFGVLQPGHVTPNLMAANVTGGAASQCADLMHDLKTGWLVGAMARHQLIAQYFGALAGATIGSAAYLLLIPDPAKQLFTDAWPAPAVTTWKTVAEIFSKGITAMPPGTQIAALIGGAVGIVLALSEKLLTGKARAWVPSPAAVGLAFVIPAHNSVNMFIGAAGGAALSRWVPSWSGRFLVVVASGFIAGEGIAGVAVAIESLARE